jgi:hypothetical protein
MKIDKWTRKEGHPNVAQSLQRTVEFFQISTVYQGLFWTRHSFNNQNHALLRYSPPLTFITAQIQVQQKKEKKNRCVVSDVFHSWKANRGMKLSHNSRTPETDRFQI